MISDNWLYTFVVAIYLSLSILFSYIIYVKDTEEMYLLIGVLWILLSLVTFKCLNNTDGDNNFSTDSRNPTAIAISVTPEESDIETHL